MPDPSQAARELVAVPLGLDTQPMPMVFDDEYLNSPWSCAGADAAAPEELG
jgi:hypothetical protein